MTGLDRRDFVKAAGATGAGLSLSGAAGAVETISSSLDTDGGLQEAIVVFRDADDADLLDAFDLAKGRYDYEVLPMSWTFLAGDQLATLAEDDRVLHVSDAFELEYYNDPESREAMHVEAANAAGYDGSTVDAVVIDTGLDGHHPDLQGRIDANYEYVDEPLGDRDPQMWVDVANGDTDDVGHGTHCCGIVGGDGTVSRNDPSAPSYEGLAPGVTLSSYSVSQTIYLPYAVGAWDHVIARKLDESDSFDPDVCSNSYGVARGNRYNPLDPLNLATWEAFEAGILPVFALGNDGPERETISRYAKAPHVIGVAAATKNKAVTGFSSRGRAVGGSLPGGGEVTEAYHDRANLLSNLEDYFDLLDEYRKELLSGTFSGMLGPAVRAPYGLVDQGGQRASKKLSLTDLEEDPDTLEGTLSVTPDGQQVELSVYEDDGFDDPTSGELLARMGEEPVYIHKDLALDLPADGDVWLVAETQNAAGVQFEFEYAVYDYADPSATDNEDLAANRELTLYRPGVVTHGNLVMATMSQEDVLAPTDTTRDGATDPFYTRISGTSMACPAAAGVAALVIDAGKKAGMKYVGYGEVDDPATEFSPADVIAAIENTTDTGADVTESTPRAERVALANYTPASAGTGFVDADAATTEITKADRASLADVSTVSPDTATVLDVTGTRSDDGSAFTGGGTNQINVDVTEITNASAVHVFDYVPSEWGVVGGDAERESEASVAFPEQRDGYTTVYLGEASGQASFTYFVEAPSDPSQSGRYSFGPAVARTNADLTVSQVEFAGEDANNVVVGQSQP